jgi:long-chain acyl-CoA synthetase
VPWVSIRQGYGLTETAALVSSNPTGAERQGSVGRPVPGTEVEIRDDEGRVLPTGEVGEICARSPGVMQGYWRSPEASAQALSNGWLLTGDVGYLDEDGYLYIVDRKNFMIITGSYNVYPVVVENALSEHGSVREACVFGIPDERWGEAVCAVVVPEQHVTDLGSLRAELLQLARERLAAFEVPKRVDFATELPRGSTGKLLKRVVRDRYWAAASTRH